MTWDERQELMVEGLEIRRQAVSSARARAIREALAAIEGVRRDFDGSEDRHPDWTAGYGCGLYDCAAAVLRLLETSE